MALQIPSVFSKTNAYDFFCEFLHLNSKKRGFSQRAFSQKIGWPNSYLPDLIKRRKSFTVKRAVEFGNYFRLGPIDFEKLIYLAILDSGLASELDISKIISAKSSARKKKSEDQELLTVSIFIVFECIRWLHGKASVETLEHILIVKGFDKKTIQDSVQILLRKKLIEKNGRQLVTLSPSLYSDDSDDRHTGKEVHQEFMNLQAKFFDAPIGPAIYNSAILHIDRERFEEIADRIIAFRNWLFEISAVDAIKSLEADVRLFQIDLNLTPLFDSSLSKKLRNS